MATLIFYYLRCLLTFICNFSCIMRDTSVKMIKPENDLPNYYEWVAKKKLSLDEKITESEWAPQYYFTHADTKDNEFDVYPYDLFNDMCIVEGMKVLRRTAEFVLASKNYVSLYEDGKWQSRSAQIGYFFLRIRYIPTYTKYIMSNKAPFEKYTKKSANDDDSEAKLSKEHETNNNSETKIHKDASGKIIVSLFKNESIH